MAPVTENLEIKHKLMNLAVRRIYSPTGTVIVVFELDNKSLLANIGR